MTSWQATGEDGPSGSDGALRAVGLVAVCVGVAALAAGTFVLSYQGIREVALEAGIEPRYARGYPLLIDAMLVIVLAAVLALRRAGLPSRILAWLTLLVVLCSAAGADTLHATGHTLPHDAAVITAAVLPWALVFVAFVLLLAMLRHGRLRRLATVALSQQATTPPTADGQALSQQRPTALVPPLPVRSPQPWNSVSIVPGFTSQLVSSASAGAVAGAAAADVEPWAGAATAIDDAPLELADTGAEDAGNDQPAPAAQPSVDSADAEQQTDEVERRINGAARYDDEPDRHTDAPQPLTDELALQGGEPELQTEVPDFQNEEAALVQPADDEPGPDEAHAQPAGADDTPVSHRIRSSPTPPEE